MRRLQTHDVFVAMRLVKAAKVKEAIAKIAGMKGTAQRAAGFEMIMEILGNTGDPEAEKVAVEFLSGIMEISPEELEKMDALDLMQKLHELGEVISIEEWKDFFASVLKLMK